MKKLAVIILAAGKGERMVSDRPKVLHHILGKSLLGHVVSAAQTLHPEKIIVVVGHKSDDVKKAFEKEASIEWVFQEQQLGTAHAVLCAKQSLKDFEGEVLILYGDAPLLRAETLKEMREVSEKSHADLLLATAHFQQPSGYGRILRNHHGKIQEIVEEKEASSDEKKIQEVNPGIYLLDAQILHFLDKIEKSIAKGEYYLTDIVVEALKQKKVVETYLVPHEDEVKGINNKSQLAEATQILQKRINEAWMAKGVTMVSPETTFIESSVILEVDVIVHPGVVITGNSKVGKGSEILAYSVIEESIVGNGTRIGPFAHLRPASVVGDEAHVGNFVELKKTTLGKGSKANHLAYLGDAVIGEKANIGAGTITCNYDGEKKFQTIIEDGAFIGSDTQLVAPVKVGKKAYVGSGTTVTKDVPDGALALSRIEQKNIPNWKKKGK
ncbi:MAG: bifunctional UDP-N-acetylglucosamine diphosphorylase/glucosamine-1-phosphate N-acetyltransferase GlmU [Deltaproteobacteria bacterium]|nr:MAG: bifunctional UDP-N-acetylglucosamine diphosphorylase/glucosamine-1-phosphate N-acetyltransferase GlmU [Deltaproteobacteria bacterium]